MGGMDTLNLPVLVDSRPRNGRPPKLSPALIAEIAGFVREGLTNADACQMAGISASSFYGWLQRAEAEPGSIFSDLLDSLKDAQVAFKHANIQRIQAASMTPFRAHDDQGTH